MNVHETSNVDDASAGDTNGDTTVTAATEHENLEAYVLPIETDSDSYVDSQELCQFYHFQCGDYIFKYHNHDRKI